jgi:hypothetical protein
LLKLPFQTRLVIVSLALFVHGFTRLSAQLAILLHELRVPGVCLIDGLLEIPQSGRDLLNGASQLIVVAALLIELVLKTSLVEGESVDLILFFLQILLE